MTTKALTKSMQALITQAKALGQALDAHYAEFDCPTSDLMRSLAEWVRKQSGENI